MVDKIFIKFASISDVKSFVDIVSKCSFDIDLISGRYVIDAKSIMGIFSLDLSKQIQIVPHTDDPEPLKKSISNFLVK
ncbi:MAG: HPr family phosphocarrier protein [Clostridia bacterium]